MNGQNGGKDTELRRARATPILTVKETAALLGVSTRTIYAWIQDGRIPSERFGPKLLRVPTERLLAPVRKPNGVR